MGGINHMLTATFYFGRGFRYGESYVPGPPKAKAKETNGDPLVGYAIRTGTFVHAKAYGDGMEGYSFKVDRFGIGFYKDGGPPVTLKLDETPRQRAATMEFMGND